MNLNRRSLVVVAMLALSAPRPAIGQTPTPAARDSLWLDSASTRPEAEVYRAWRAYYESKGRALMAGAQVRSDLWVTDEQAKWPMYDLVGFYVPPGSTPEVTDITPIAGGVPSDYEVAVQFWKAPSGTGAERTVATRGSWRVVRQKGRWLVANILPERTRRWRREAVGRITYHIEPGMSFDRGRARLAARFVDSLADAFGVPRLPRLDYYKTSTVDAALHAVGLNDTTHYGPGGGFAKPVNLQLFAAVPVWGENYRHELTHLVVRPLLDGRTLTLLATEGMATWYGGSAGHELPEAVGILRGHLIAHPAVTLDSIMVVPTTPQVDLYASGAVLCEMLSRHGGVADLKGFLSAGPGPAQLREALTRMLGEPWEAVLAEWRKTVDRMAAPARTP